MSPRRLLVETDGGSRGNPGPAGYGAVVSDGESGRRLATRAGFLGTTTNNVAEYTALLEGLRAAALIDPAARIEVRADSKLVVEQMSGRWKIKHEEMRRLASEARAIVRPENVTYTWVPRAQNTAADALANAAMDRRAEISTDEWRSAETAEREAEDEKGASFGTPRPELTEATRVYLVRHGVTELTETGRQSGSDTPGPPLTELGREQARGAGRALRRLLELAGADPADVRVLASPIVRAQQTAAIVTKVAGLAAAETDERLREVVFGEWDAKTVDEIDEGWPGEYERWRQDIDVRPAGGESHREVGERVGQVLQEVAGLDGGAVVLVAHAVVVRSAVALVGRMESSGWGTVRVRPGSTTLLRVGGLDGEGRFLGEVQIVGAPAELV